jgi:hypothetical protein
VRDAPPPVAVIVTAVDAVTDDVAIANAALVAPCGTDTLAGTVAAALLLDSVTVAPPAGAAALNVTVPCDADPPATLAGFTDTDATGGDDDVVSGFTVSCADFVTPPPLTEIVAMVCVVTCDVNTLKPAAVTPAGIVTLLLTRAIAG